MGLMEKAKELGREIRNTDQYREMEKKGEHFREDDTAQQLVKEVQEAQQKLQFARQTGVQPTQEDVEDFNKKRETMHANASVAALIKAQEDFNNVMKEVNEAITEGIAGQGEEQ